MSFDRDAIINTISTSEGFVWRPCYRILSSLHNYIYPRGNTNGQVIQNVFTVLVNQG
jgi:hypothetical protein